MEPHQIRRCDWARKPLDMDYHDREWGVPVHDDRTLFEFLILEGAQAGLSWSTILAKREAYRKAFANFDARKIARFDSEKIARLLADPGIVRNRLKISAAIENAKAFIAVRREFGTFDAFIWRLARGAPTVNAWQTSAEVPARTSESDVMSKELARRGFKFVGPTICYAFMQAVGMVNDHLTGCFRHGEVAPGAYSIQRSAISLGTALPSAERLIAES
jgi:DNA-3-methyladenine glycosylase I